MPGVYIIATHKNLSPLFLGDLFWKFFLPFFYNFLQSLQGSNGQNIYPCFMLNLTTVFSSLAKYLFKKISTK